MACSTPPIGRNGGQPIERRSDRGKDRGMRTIMEERLKRWIKLNWCCGCVGCGGAPGPGGGLAACALELREKKFIENL